MTVEETLIWESIPGWIAYQREVDGWGQNGTCESCPGRDARLGEARCPCQPTAVATYTCTECSHTVWQCEISGHAQGGAFQ